MKTLATYKEKVLLGRVDGECIYLSAPSWDCGWYWGFGYLGNRNCHYHIDGLMKGQNLYDGFKGHFGDSFKVTEDRDIWRLAELFTSFYALKESAGLFHRGGSHLTTNPCKEVLQRLDLHKEINEIMLPAIFHEIYEILNKYTPCITN